MTRWVDSLNVAAAAAGSQVPIELVDLDFLSGHVRAHNNVGPISYLGNVFLGVGHYGAVDGSITESNDFIGRSAKLTLSGVDPALVTPTMTEIYQNRTCIIYNGFLDLTLMQLVGAPNIIFDGRMDTLQVDIAEGSAVIRITCESRLLREPRAARYTDADLKLQFSGDTFFDMVPRIPLSRANWGADAVSFGGGGGGSGRGDNFNTDLP